MLLTDQGFLTEDKMVWQMLSSVHGDGNFVDSDFKFSETTSMKSQAVVSTTGAQGSGALSQEDQE